MLSFFKRINEAEKQQQIQTIAQQTAAAVATASAAKQQYELHKPGPGRPRIPFSLVPSLPDPTPDSEPPSKRSKHYQDWFLSDVIHYILDMYRKTGFSSHRTVHQLQRDHPTLYATLSRSTIDSWFEKDGKTLRKEKQKQLETMQTMKRGPGVVKAFSVSSEAKQAEEELKKQIIAIREKGATIDGRIVKLMMRVVLEKHCPSLLQQVKLSKAFVGNWVREELQFSWRVRTTSAQKLPLDWRVQGMNMAKRIAVNVHQYSVHPSLIINMDQTGLHLVPGSSRTYAPKGCKEVPVIGAEDKRQITCCIASSMSGDMLPLQLIFGGKTERCLPAHTQESIAAGVHLAHSDNHWSTQKTMQQYISEVIVPYAKRQAIAHGLQDPHIILVLDVWSVHKSIEFRTYLRKHPNIHLCFVPPNCTSKLQVADVVLQRPFKHGINCRFNEWAAETLRVQYSEGAFTGLNAHLKMKFIKPKVLQWAVESWQKLKEGSLYIQSGWKMCVSDLFDPLLQENQVSAAKEQIEGKLDFKWVPEETESEPDEDDQELESDCDSSDEEKDELDLMKVRVEGIRKSNRVRKQAELYGYRIPSNQIAMAQTGSEDSDANGM